jgi:hypothetical protein
MGIILAILATTTLALTLYGDIEFTVPIDTCEAVPSPSCDVLFTSKIQGNRLIQITWRWFLTRQAALCISLPLPAPCQRALSGLLPSSFVRPQSSQLSLSLISYGSGAGLIGNQRLQSMSVTVIDLLRRVSYLTIDMAGPHPLAIVIYRDGIFGGSTCIPSQGSSLRRCLVLCIASRRLHRKYHNVVHTVFRNGKWFHNFTSHELRSSPA